MRQCGRSWNLEHDPTSSTRGGERGVLEVPGKTRKNGSSLGSVRVHSLTLFALPGACDMTPGSIYRPATLQPPCLGREPRLGLRQSPPLEKEVNVLIDI
jgi:hypothetical protein